MLDDGCQLLEGGWWIIVCWQFMKRTREKTEIQDEEEMRSQLFDSEVVDAVLQLAKQFNGQL